VQGEKGGKESEDTANASCRRLIDIAATPGRVRPRGFKRGPART
jgi:hypothetical protein